MWSIYFLLYPRSPGGSMAKFAAPALIALFVSAIHIQTLTAQPVDRNRILAPGNPPLTEAMVNKSLDLAEWALRMTLSREERSQVQEFFTNSWKRGEKNGVIEAVEMHDIISQIPAAGKESAREKLRDLMLQNLNRDPNDRMNQIFLSAHNRAKNLPTGSATLPSVPQTGSQPISWDFSRAGTLTDTQARSVLGSAARPVEAHQTRPLPFAAAMERVRKLVSGLVGADAMSAFHSSTEGRTADSAAAVAAGAIVAEMPLLAVAALLRAHELEPANATHLANLAAVLTFIERPEEALSIISSPQVMNGTVASTLEIGGQAGVFNIRGHALLQLGRAAEAEVALRKATELYPNFAEAKANLAFALWQQEDPKKKEQGVRIIGGVWRIRPGKTMFDVVERPHITGGPDEEIAVNIFGDSTGNRRLDTSRGKQLYLPDLKIPTTLEASASMYPKYAALKTKTEDLLLAYGQGQLNPGDANKEDEAVVKRSIETYGRLSPEALLARKEKLEAIKEALELTNVQQQPAVRPHWEKLKQVFRENYSNVQTPVLTSIPMTGTAEVGPAGVELYKRLRELDRNPNYGRLACTAARSAHKRWLIGINAYDQAAREYLKAAYSFMTGVVA